jgi:hypothetical protein
MFKLFNQLIKLLLVMLIGLPKVLLLVLKIKDNVAHAGLSLPLVLSKVLAKLAMAIFKASQNNNWLIAQADMEIKVAMVV